MHSFNAHICAYEQLTIDSKSRGRFGPEQILYRFMKWIDSQALDHISASRDRLMVQLAGNVSY